jgi:glycosyltransferase involved in cell wall biosynthesis
VDALELLRGDTRLSFQFIGGGKRRPWLEAEVQRRNLTGCTFHDYVPEAELNTSLNAADLCLVTVARGFEGLLVPSKIYGIMAVGKPVLYYGAPEGDVPALVQRHQIGWVVAQGDSAGLARVLTEIATRPEQLTALGANARRAFDAHYDRPLATARYLEVFTRTAAEKL